MYLELKTGVTVYMISRSVFKIDLNVK